MHLYCTRQTIAVIVVVYGLAGSVCGHSDGSLWELSQSSPLQQFHTVLRDQRSVSMCGSVNVSACVCLCVFDMLVKCISNTAFLSGFFVVAVQYRFEFNLVSCWMTMRVFMCELRNVTPYINSHRRSCVHTHTHTRFTQEMCVCVCVCVCV